MTVTYGRFGAMMASPALVMFGLMYTNCRVNLVIAAASVVVFA